MQKVREAANRAQAQHNLALLAAGIVQFSDQTGELPTTFGQIDFVSVPQEIFPSGAANGYDYAFTPGAALAFEIRATPALPGVTGSEECSVDETLFVRCTPASGADTARLDLRRRVYTSLAPLLLPYVEQDNLLACLPSVAAAMGDGSVRNAFLEHYEQQGDGQLTLEELIASDWTAAARAALAALPPDVARPVRVRRLGDAVGRCEPHRLARPRSATSSRPPSSSEPAASSRSPPCSAIRTRVERGTSCRPTSTSSSAATCSVVAVDPSDPSGVGRKIATGGFDGLCAAAIGMADEPARGGRRVQGAREGGAERRRRQGREGRERARQAPEPARQGEGPRLRRRRGRPATRAHVLPGAGDALGIRVG